MTELSHSQVAEALWELLQSTPELQAQQQISAVDDELQSLAAALMVAVAKSGWTEWRAAPEPVRATAAVLIMDFFKLVISDCPKVATRRWPVTTVPRVRQALEVIAQELTARTG